MPNQSGYAVNITRSGVQTDVALHPHALPMLHFHTALCVLQTQYKHVEVAAGSFCSIVSQASGARLNLANNGWTTVDCCNQLHCRGIVGSVTLCIGSFLASLLSTLGIQPCPGNARSARLEFEGLIIGYTYRAVCTYVKCVGNEWCSPTS